MTIRSASCDKMAYRFISGCQGTVLDTFGHSVYNCALFLYKLVFVGSRPIVVFVIIAEDRSRTDDKNVAMVEEAKETTYRAEPYETPHQEKGRELEPKVGRDAGENAGRARQDCQWTGHANHQGNKTRAGGRCARMSGKKELFRQKARR
jgi:hypothetical protein